MISPRLAWVTIERSRENLAITGLLRALCARRIQIPEDGGCFSAIAGFISCRGERAGTHGRRHIHALFAAGMGRVSKYESS